MSAIAAFYLIDDAQRDAVVGAARAASFWDFMQENASELEAYPYSGFLLLDLVSLAPAVLASEDEVGRQLAALMESTFVSFSPAEALRGIGVLDATDCSEAALQRFLAEEGREEEGPDLIPAIQDSVAHLRDWFAAVSTGKTGILSIG